MARKSLRQSFDQVIEGLRMHGFEVSSSDGVQGGFRVSKYGVAAVLAQAANVEGGPGTFVERPGILIQGKVARLLDRGYQKFIKTSQFELPATAAQLHAIHRFSEELTQLIGGTSLYNQSLGTTSDVYEYDRLVGREDHAPAPAKRPWELTEGH